MSDLVCAICASKNANNLINIDTGQLRDLYDIVCGIKTQLINALPSYICLLCASQLTKFYNIQNQFRTGIQTIQQLNSLIQQNPDNNYVIDRSEVTIHRPLAHSEPDTMKFIEMKYQPFPMFKSKPQNKNQTSIPSFHIDIKKTSKGIHVNKIKSITEDNKQFDGSYQNDDIENMFNIVSTENNNSLNYNGLTGNQNFKIDIEIDYNSVQAPTLESLSKVLYIKKGMKLLEKFMKITLLKPNEARAVNDLCAHIRNRNLSYEEKKKICDVCLIYVGGDIDSHKKEHEGENTCSICFSNFMHSGVLQQHHINLHLFKYICRICDDVLYKYSDARIHMKSVHNKNHSEVGEINLERIKAYLNLESHFNCAPSTWKEATEIMLKPFKGRNYVTCDICMKKIKNQYFLMLHQQKHVLGPGQVQCDICKYTFSNKSKLKRHYKYQHYWKYSCKYCDYATTVRPMACSHKLMHLSRGDDIMKYKCEYCDKEFRKATSLATHHRFAHPCNAICNICGESFAKYTGVKKHMTMSHTQQEREVGQLTDLNKDPSSELYCKDCNIQFINQDAYDTHLLNSGKHTAINIGYRSLCNFEQYNSVMNVNERMLDVVLTSAELSSAVRVSTKVRSLCRSNNISIERQKMRKISLATRRISLKKEREKREREKETQKKTQNCHICGVELTGVVMARKHFHKYHRDDPYYLEHLKRTYKCDLCDYTTESSANVYIHKKCVHSSVRPFRCPHCDQGFKTKGNMQRHLLVHTGERSYECAHCNKCFQQKSTVQLHIQTVHLKIPYPPWQKKKNRRCKEENQEEEKKTTNKRKKCSNEVEQEVVEEEIEYYLEEQEMATDYVMNDNLVYSTTSNVTKGQQSSYVISINEP